MADSPVLASLVESVVLVLAAEVATKPSVARAVDQINGVGAKVVGVVLNKVNLERNSYYYSQNYGEYYRSYYAEGPSSARGSAETAQRPTARVGQRPARRV
jgi:Mrp family chromosome partitioning ATPase